MVGDCELRIPVCEHAVRGIISRSLVHSLNDLEERIGFELHFNSGFRCPVCNKAAGGVPNSSHLRGQAVDVSAPDSATRFRIIHNALGVGFRRVGIGKNFVHLDLDETLPLNMLWLYT